MQASGSGGGEVLRLNVWSGPRNVSTALMYAFAQRADTRVLDEPLYAHYLRVSGAPHPGREQALAAQDTDGERVVREVMFGPCDRPVLFCKQMAHHLVELDWGFLNRATHVLLVRDPREVLLSLGKVLERPTLADTGFDEQARLHAHLLELGQDVPVLEARRLLSDPAGVLRALCERLRLRFEPAMLSWPAGPRPEDGVWAPYWYANLHRSTGFEPFSPRTEPLPEALAPVLEACRPHYDALLPHVIEGTSP